MRPKKIAIIADPGKQPWYILQTIAFLQASQTIDFVAWIEIVSVNSPKNNLKYSSKYKIILRKLRSYFYSFVRKLEILIFSSDSLPLDQILNRHSLLLPKSVRTLKLNNISQKPYVRVSVQDINLLKSLEIDIFIRACSGIILGELLSTATYGILSVHHGDNRKFRGGPPGFWESYFNQASTGFVVQVLNSSLDGGTILYRGSVRSSSFFTKNYAKVTIKSLPFLFDAILNLPLQAPEKPIPYSGPIFKLPGLTIQSKYLTKNFIYISDLLLRRITRRAYSWKSFFLFADDWRSSSLRCGIELTSPSGTYNADPFAFNYSGSDYVFVEEYDYCMRKGCIAVYQVFSDQTFKYIGRVLEEAFHLSFPRVFLFQSRIYMTVESIKSKQIRLYVSDVFPVKWTLLRVLKDNIEAADPILFQSDDRWWLMYSIDSSQLGEYDSEFELYYSDSPLSSDWHRHSFSGSLSDVDGCRNAGLFNVNNELVRASQNQGINQYGKSVTLSKVTDLTSTFYNERVICKLEADWLFDPSAGIHTFNVCSQVICFDLFSRP